MVSIASAQVPFGETIGSGRWQPDGWFPPHQTWSRTAKPSVPADSRTQLGSVVALRKAASSVSIVSGAMSSGVRVPVNSTVIRIWAT